MGSSREPVKEVPSKVVDEKNGREFVKGQFLGKGGFARCYELREVSTSKIYAGKVVSKTLLAKEHQKRKMAQEIEIHRSLSHPNVVRLEGFFEDSDNVYILLELCSRRSLMELHKRRRAVTELEARYFVKQIVQACEYLHGLRIVHRDLKLGNLFLSDEMQVKIGDFGLATVLNSDCERKRTLCGTPNYIAPEMVEKKGHSYGVDIWAIGCVLYTLLVGRPPFETGSLEETYEKIKKNDYAIPSKIGSEATLLIKRLLAADPSKRPNIQEVAKFDFFKGYTPPRLPTSCLTTAPKHIPEMLAEGNSRHILTEKHDQEGLRSRKQARHDILMAHARSLTPVPELNAIVVSTRTSALRNEQDSEKIPNDGYLGDLLGQIDALIGQKPNERSPMQEAEAEDPASIPVYWVSKWVDYSDKYGLGYQLCDNSFGVSFNDNTKMVLDAAESQVMYMDRENKESYHSMSNYPSTLQKKMTLLDYFRNYMTEHLQKAGETHAPREGDELARLPFLRKWFRTRVAIILHLSNGTVQLNFFEDHTKLILCPLMGAATYIDEKRRFRVFKMELLARYGCSPGLFDRIKYARSMVDRLLLPREEVHGRTIAKPASPARGDHPISQNSQRSPFLTH